MTNESRTCIHLKYKYIISTWTCTCSVLSSLPLSNKIMLVGACSSSSASHLEECCPFEDNLNSALYLCFSFLHLRVNSPLRIDAQYFLSQVLAHISLPNHKIFLPSFYLGGGPKRGMLPSNSSSPSQVVPV